ncbi:glycosyltransferase [Candidatus Binatia bacterium]|nr:glycosyltransferase [Candidatus Binatia bacterium]
MIRVAYVIDHLRVGGAQRHLLEVVRGLDRREYALEMWSAAEDPGDLAAVFEREGVPVRSFGISGTMMSPRTLSAVRRVAADFRARDVHVVHGYLFEGNFLAALTGRLAGAPVTLVSKRSLDRYDRFDRRAAAWLSNQLASRVTVNATAVRDVTIEHERCAPERIVLIPNGVALPASAASAPASATAADDPRGDGPLVGMVGRLSWKKGYEFALQAAARLRDRIPGVRFDIVGDGEQRRELEEMAQRLGLGDTVRFLGQRRDVADLMRGFDCFVLSSVIEGMPNALLEAMALGRPAVTTSAGGSAEVVIDGESGLVVPPGDPTALAVAVERVLRDPELARRLGAAGERRVRDSFSLDTMLRAFDHLYRTELARAGLQIPAPTAEGASATHDRITHA